MSGASSTDQRQATTPNPDRKGRQREAVLPAKSVQACTPDRLRELAKEDPSNVVYEVKHETTYIPWVASDVDSVMDELVSITRKSSTPEAARETARKDRRLSEFGDKYQVFFSKLTDPSFVAYDRNLSILKEMIRQRERVEKGELTEQEAGAMSSRFAMENLLPRMDSKRLTE